MCNRVWSLFWLLLASSAQSVLAEPVNVANIEGTLHGFTVLRTLDGKDVADGDMVQIANGDQVKTHLRFVFKDGSIHEEITVFSQKKMFKLISYKLIQKGPTFLQPLQMTVDGITGEATVEYSEKGEQKKVSEKVEIPDDLSNGLVFTLMKSVPPEKMPKKLSYIAATPTPRLIDLKIIKIGQEPYLLGNTKHIATHYILRPDLGAFIGLLAKIFGKQPPDTHIWVSDGEAPTFLKAEQVLFVGGPMWRVELTSPSWPNPSTNPK